MPTTPAKRPADHRKPKDEKLFSFDHDGKTHTFPEPVSRITSPGFVRRNRHRDEVDFGFTAIEELAGDTPQGKECLDAVDDMTPDEFNSLCEAIFSFAEMPLGE